MRPLKLRTLHNGTFGLTRSLGGIHAEAAAVCLTDSGHRSGALLEVRADERLSVRIVWDRVTAQMRRSFRDEEEATEWGAVGVALVVLRRVENLKYVERAYKEEGGGGFDYWVGNTSAGLFQNKLRLEVSGIRRGDDGALERRIVQKVNQTMKSDGSTGAIVVVVEFGRPVASITKR